ncbi:ribokinase [Candidatus Methylomirabilis sp.]|uniref:ribokinase n=1 Tax=Candidatus Methylomirabilis sp. TaxID=2032687 RepID=UPI002A63FE9F|nr:ribokinase [Candidatus Methylomirabilis sp.]
MPAACLSQQVVVIGSANLDLTVIASRLPREGETVLGGELLLSNGGKGANQAVAALKAGAEVRFLAKVGRDPFGDRICRDLVAAGLPADGLLRDESAPTGVALIVVDRQGRNQIAVAPGSNQLLLPVVIEQHEPFLAHGTVMLVQLEIPIVTVERALQFAKAHGMTTILNPAPASALSDDLLRHVDLLTPNETEAEALTGIAVSDLPSAAAAAKALLLRGPHVVIVTLGAQGALLCTASIVQHLPAIPVAAVDTTAAGDAFNGALAAALAGKPQTDTLRTGRLRVLEDIVRFANAAGALTTTKRGAQESLPTKAEIERLLAARPLP